MPELERGIEVRLGDFLGGTFEHDQFGFVADIDEVEIAFGHLGMGWIGDELAFDAADADGAERPAPRDVADHERG